MIRLLFWGRVHRIREIYIPHPPQHIYLIYNTHTYPRTTTYYISHLPSPPPIHTPRHPNALLLYPTFTSLLYPSPPSPTFFLAYCPTPYVSLTNTLSYPTCDCSLQSIGQTALIVASANGHTEIVQALIAAAGIDVNHAMVNISPLIPSHVVVG